MAILSCHVSIKLPPKISDGQKLSAGVIAPIFGLNHPDSVNHLVRRVDRALARSSELREDIGMTQRILEQRRHGSS